MRKNRTALRGCQSLTGFLHGARLPWPVNGTEYQVRSTEYGVPSTVYGGWGTTVRTRHALSVLGTRYTVLGTQYGVPCPSCTFSLEEIASAKRVAIKATQATF